MKPMMKAPASMAGSEQRTELYRITPAMAKKWLATNTESNRNLSLRTVEAYAGEMKASRWQVTHQGIAFNRTGELVDGQHRLEAIVLAEVNVDMNVTTGLPLEFNSPIDVGYNRTTAHIMGKSSRWVSIVRALTLLERGMPATAFKSTPGIIGEVAARHMASLEEVTAITTTAKFVPAGTVAAIVYALPVNPTPVLNFARELQTGELLTKGDPSLALQKWIRQGRHTGRETIFASLAAIRAVLMKRTLSRIVAGVNGDSYDGSSAYNWLVGRRRARKIWLGTPSVEEISSRRADEKEEEET